MKRVNKVKDIREIWIFKQDKVKMKNPFLIKKKKIDNSRSNEANGNWMVENKRLNPIAISYSKFKKKKMKLPSLVQFHCIQWSKRKLKLKIPSFLSDSK